jgi:hypothetical protein
MSCQGSSQITDFASLVSAQLANQVTGLIETIGKHSATDTLLGLDQAHPIHVA